MTKSIFDIERRLNISAEIKSLNSFMDDNKFKLSLKRYTFFELLNMFFIKWDYRGTSLTYQQYLLNIGIKNTSLLNGEQVLYYLEFLINISEWLPRNIDGATYFDDEKEINDARFDAIYNNCFLILEHMNYTIIENKDVLRICKRNADADSIITVTQNKTLADLLLSYLDFRNEKSIPAKRDILVQLNTYLEKDKNMYRSADSQLFKDISAIMNNAGIRHKENMNPKLSRKEQFVWFDNCFIMVLHLIRKVNILQIQKQMNEEFKLRCRKA